MKDFILSVDGIFIIVFVMIFFPKIPEIDLRRFSFQFSFEVVVAIHEK
jgi:hypothetical protein